MQSSVDVGVGSGTGEGVLDVEGDNIPSASTGATSLVTPARNGLAGGGFVGSIFRGRWCVIMSTCLCLPRLRERSEQPSGDFGIACLGVAALNIQPLVYRLSDAAWDAPSLYTFSSFSVTPHRRTHPPASGLRRCTRFCKHQVIPYSSAGKQYSRCLVASAGPPFPTLLRNQLLPRPAVGVHHHSGTCRKGAIQR
jgi:hypothetical protein